jgi:hypothetical protein
MRNVFNIFIVTMLTGDREIETPDAEDIDLFVKNKDSYMIRNRGTIFNSSSPRRLWCFIIVIIIVNIIKKIACS